jgi:hypothetical protein
MSRPAPFALLSEQSPVLARRVLHPGADEVLILPLAQRAPAYLTDLEERTPSGVGFFVNFSPPKQARHDCRGRIQSDIEAGLDRSS